MEEPKSKVAVIAGAGPAGLTAAYELLKNTDIKPVIYEMSNEIGGISKTVNYKGNRIDIGGHRFFSKSDRVMDWWHNIMPIQGAPSKDDLLLDIAYHKKTRQIELDPNGPNPETTDLVMLIRNRLSRIIYLRKFFSYPVSLSMETINNLGLWRMTKIGFSYIKIRLFPIRIEGSLEDFFINRFGRELYLTFFKDYTEKLWGLPCDKISAEWGAQRIKGLSISKAVAHAVKSVVNSRKGGGVSQKNVETSLIERFLYPKFGPGQMWEEVARIVKEKGGEVIMEHSVVGIDNNGGRINSVTVRDEKTGETKEIACDYFFSTMPVKELIEEMKVPAPDNVREVAGGLLYRDFITVGLLLEELKVKNNTETVTLNNLIPDTWVYVQERDVKILRFQIFNNWSPYMVKDINQVWVGLEYTCSEGDELWSKTDEEFIKFAIDEMASVDIIDKSKVLDSTIIRVKKTYPVYFGAYERFDEVRDYVNGFANMFLIGRNGMHKYNNQDHSMLTAMTAVENIMNGVTDKSNLWAVNTEEDYHESKAGSGS